MRVITHFLECLSIFFFIGMHQDYDRSSESIIHLRPYFRTTIVLCFISVFNRIKPVAVLRLIRAQLFSISFSTWELPIPIQSHTHFHFSMPMKEIKFPLLCILPITLPRWFHTVEHSDYTQLQWSYYSNLDSSIIVISGDNKQFFSHRSYFDLSLP